MCARVVGGNLDQPSTCAMPFSEPPFHRAPPSEQPSGNQRKLLLNIFNVPQCDRTEEGEAFVPPDPNLEYITKAESRRTTQ